jgi:thiosulfate reductase cytochrome b subunit
MAQSANAANIMNRGTRSILRWIHIVFAIPIIGYIYSPFEDIPNYAPVVRFVAVPVIALSGLWMWKGHVLRQLISKRSAQRDTAATAVARQEYQ